MASGKAIVGGLLTGLGEGLVESAQRKREEALARAEQLARRQADEADRDFRRDLQKDDQEFRRGLLSRIEPNAKGNLIGITAGGETRDLGVTASPKAMGTEDEAGLSASDQRLLSFVVEKYTDDSLEGGGTDWAAAAKELSEQHNRPDLAKLAAPAGGGSGIDVSSAEYREAQRMAEEWASDEAGLFRTDETDFKDFKGNRQGAIQAKTMEFYRQLTGQGPTVAGGGGSESSSAAVAPPGSGTQADPYRATTQAAIDWFKQSAPAGSVLEVNGKLYQK